MNAYRENAIVHAHGMRWGEALPRVCEGGGVPTRQDHWEGVTCPKCLNMRTHANLVEGSSVPAGWPR